MPPNRISSSHNPGTYKDVEEYHPSLAQAQAEEQEKKVTVYDEFSLLCDVCVSTREVAKAAVKTLRWRRERILVCPEHLPIVETLCALNDRSEL